MSSDEICLQFKIVLLGETSVGKTSLIYRFTNDDFVESQVPTIGMAFSKKVVERGNMRICLDIWDTAGQEQYKKIAPIYYRNAQGVILVMDLSRPHSLVEAEEWLNEVDEYVSVDCVKYLVGNKVDMLLNVEVEQAAVEFASARGLYYLSVSARSGLNVERLFRRMARSLAKSRLRKLDQLEQKQVVNLNQAFDQPIQKQCCV